MNTAVMFLILYLIPFLTFASTFGLYMLAYGKSLDSPIIDFALLLIVSGIIVSSYMSVKLISQFVANEVIYLGIFFSILGWLLGFIPLAIYSIMFK